MTIGITEAQPTTATIRASITRELPALTALRRELHASPELSHAETRTSARIQAELARLGVAFRAGVGGPTPGTGTGVVAHLPATTAAQGPAVAPTSTHCPSPSAPASPTPARTPASCTPAGTTGTPRSSSARPAYSPRCAIGRAR
jgi:hippurate hydrolase